MRQLLMEKQLPIAQKKINRIINHLADSSNSPDTLERLRTIGLGVKEILKYAVRISGFGKNPHEV
jgi:hypothetical protein